MFGPAIRTERWPSLYKNICEGNDIEIEIVFCGNVKPDFNLPKNFIFIYSEVKPSQCAQIALKYTNSEIVSLIGDDCVFSKNYFDNLYEAYIKNSSFIYGGAFKRNNIFYAKRDYMLLDEISDSPFFPLSPLLCKKEIMSLGGIDKNFIAVMWHEDLLMRLITNFNKKCKIIDKSVCYEETTKDLSLIKRVYIKYISKVFSKKYVRPGANLFEKYGINHDLPYLKSCWIDTIKNIGFNKVLCRNETYFISKNRLIKFDPFNEINLETVTQGKKGKW